MNILQRGVRSVIRKPIKSILLLLTVIVISSFFMAGLTSQSASINVQDSTRQAVGATFRLELSETNRQKRLDEAVEALDSKEGEYNGVTVEQLPSGIWKIFVDNSFQTIKLDDVEKLSQVKGIENYNLITAITAVNPINFKRIEDVEKDQSSDQKGVNLRGNRIMDMDMDVAAGKIKLTEGRLVNSKDKDVCVISKELAEMNNLKIGDKLEFNNCDDRENSKVYSAEIIGIYEEVQKMTPLMSGDTYRSENTIFTDMNFPEKPSGNMGNPLFQYAILKVNDVNEYEEIKEKLQNTDINWERYDFIDNNGNLKNMAENFDDMEKSSRLLLILISASSFVILSLIFIFWMKNRNREIGIYMALGDSKKKIWAQFLVEAFLIGVVGIVLSLGTAPMLGKTTASYLAQQTQEQKDEKESATANQISADGYIAPDLIIQNVEIEITNEILLKDVAAISGLLFLSVSISGIVIMRKSPREILSEMS